ncbi:MAG: hydroxyacylglutathione hydrolase [Bdellovibrio sp.]
MKPAVLYVELIPIFEDNYVFAVIDKDRKKVLLIDPGESTKTEAFLKQQNLTPEAILLTHHHNDHIGGVEKLKSLYDIPVYAPLKNQRQIPFADHFVQEGDSFTFSGFLFSVMELPGHTLGHVAYWCADKKWLFSGDVLFGLGCGRLFEGTAEQMYTSLQRLKELPEATLIYCTHEYTLANYGFCQMLTKYDDSPLTGDSEELEIYGKELLGRRELNIPSVPLKLAIEKRVNPFLLARDAHQFQSLRELRNKM